ncbi:MAG TPA: glycosyltransferase family 4 protein [Holophaga sp.]|nr:glycosyltransferase family 4 protein [Holophaga sp.]
MQSGGAQRVMSILANAWAAQGREVSLLTLEGPGSRPFFPLDSRVRYIPLGLSSQSIGLAQKVSNNAARLRRLRRELRGIRPDLLLSFIDRTNVLALFGCTGLGFPVVVSERVDPASYDIGRIWNLLRMLSYPLAASIVVQVASIRSFFPSFLRKRIHVIPNPVLPPGPDLPAAETRPRIIGAGRLTSYKGFDLLLEAFARVANRHPEWRLDLLGEGPERSALEAQARELGLGGRVRLMGNRSDITAQMRGADIFVLSSRAEGFPNVLCEAMAAGVAVVSFDCPTGPSDILRPGVDGLLVPLADVPGLAEALDRLMGSSELRRDLAARAPEILERFGESSILEQWEACFRGLEGEGA